MGGLPVIRPMASGCFRLRGVKKDVLTAALDKGTGPQASQDPQVLYLQSLAKKCNTQWTHTCTNIAGIMQESTICKTKTCTTNATTMQKQPLQESTKPPKHATQNAKSTCNNKTNAQALFLAKPSVVAGIPYPKGPSTQ